MTSTDRFLVNFIGVRAWLPEGLETHFAMSVDALMPLFYFLIL